MRIRSIAPALVALALAGCSSGHPTAAASPSPPPTSTSPSASASPGAGATTSPAPAATPSPSGSPTPAATGSNGVQNLVVTAAVQHQLLARAAAAHNVPAGDFVGLVPGETYYALDRATGTYWAGASVIPSRTSTRAEVAVQDNGGYYVFSLHGGDPAHGAWQVHDVGMAGVGASRCTLEIPAGVLAAWGWAPGACRPQLLR